MSKEAVKSPSGDFEFFDKQGHRGCRGLMPENTIPAMINALGMAITTLEMDVVITKDKKVILSHEPFFNHEITTTAKKRKISIFIKWLLRKQKNLMLD